MCGMLFTSSLRSSLLKEHCVEPRNAVGGKPFSSDWCSAVVPALKFLRVLWTLMEIISALAIIAIALSNFCRCYGRVFVADYLLLSVVFVSNIGQVLKEPNVHV